MAFPTLNLVFDEISFELGFNGEKYELILTPEGDKVNLFELVYFRKHAPKEVLEHWNILVGRQPIRNIGLRTDDGWDISGEDVQIWLEEQGEHSFAISAYCEKLLPMLRENENRAWWMLTTASIENVVKMHPDYAVRSTLRLIIGCNSQEELDALDIRPGGRYLAFGADYIDRDLELRTTLAGTHRCSVEDIDLSKISYDLTEDEKKTASPDFLPVAKYSSGEKTTILGQDMVDAIDSCTMTVTHWHGLYSETQLDYAIDGSETGVLLNDQYLDAYMTPLETDLDVFLSSNAGIEWRSAVQELDTQYHTVSVIGTDLLESMYCFHQKDSFVTEGRSFGADDYKNGSNVCLISETTAIASGLGI